MIGLIFHYGYILKICWFLFPKCITKPLKETFFHYKSKEGNLPFFQSHKKIFRLNAIHPNIGQGKASMTQIFGGREIDDLTYSSLARHEEEFLVNFDDYPFS